MPLWAEKPWKTTNNPFIELSVFAGEESKDNNLITKSLKKSIYICSIETTLITQYANSVAGEVGGEGLGILTGAGLFRVKLWVDTVEH